MGTVITQVFPQKPVEPTRYQDWYLVSNDRIVHTQGFAYGEDNSWWSFQIPFPPYDLNIHKTGSMWTAEGWEMIETLEAARSRLRIRLIAVLARVNATLNALDEGTFHTHELTSSQQ